MTADGEVSLARDRAAELVVDRGVFLFLGRHPRANLDSATDICISVARRGSRALILDCDHNITFETARSRLGERDASRILLSHPEDMASLVSDLRSAGSMPDVGVAFLNRPSSLVGASDPVARSREKSKLWRSIHSLLSSLSERCPVLVLEDSRKIEQVEYKVHPALYYIAGTILEAVEDGKNVLHYRITKRSPRGS